MPIECSGSTLHAKRVFLFFKFLGFTSDALYLKNMPPNVWGDVVTLKKLCICDDIVNRYPNYSNA